MTDYLTDNNPILIAGPTASGKSGLALKIARDVNGAIVNADALQVYSGWSVLTARPPQDDLNKCPHFMYGHIDMTTPYSVGKWLTDIKTHLEICKERGLRPIIVGGTGLYLSALTEGLVDIPETPDAIRDEANSMVAASGKDIFARILEKIDAETYAKIDVQNPMRTQRAWEVLVATGKGLADWHKTTQTPIINIAQAHLMSLMSDIDWLNSRIDMRFDMMIDEGALDECTNAMDTFWDEKLPSCKAIGAKELISHLHGTVDLTDAIAAAKLQTRQYAKRQRTWFRSRMSNWKKIDISDI